MASTWSIPQPIRRRPLTPTPYPLTYAFDPKTGDFAVDANGRIPITSGRASAVQAAAFLATIQRGIYTRIFSRQFGVNLSGAIRGGLSRKSTENLLALRMSTSAKTDARVRGLEEFAFVWSDADALTVRYTLVLSDGYRIRQEVQI
jgi:hypothetical protein